MQPFSKSSFIPKKSIKRVERVRGKKRVYIIAYVAYGLFFGTLVATLLVFLYLSYLESELDTKIAELDEQRKTYNHADLQVIQDWEYKLRLAESFYYNHLSPYRVLRDLEQYTASDIRFTSFSYGLTSGSEGTEVRVSLAGETDRFDSVAFQDTAFSSESIFRSAEIGSVTKTVSEAPATNAEEAAAIAARESDEMPAKPVSFSVVATLDSKDIAFDMAAYDDLRSSSATVQTATDLFTAPTVEITGEASTTETTTEQADDAAEDLPANNVEI